MNTGQPDINAVPTPELEADPDLIESAIAGNATPAQLSQLRGLLRSNPAALSAYMEQLRVHALLQWRSGQVSARGEATVSTLEHERHSTARIAQVLRPVRRPKVWITAAAILLAATVAFLSARRPNAFVSTPQVATAEPVADVAEMRDVVWADGQQPLAVGLRLPPGEISLTSGTLRLNSRADTAITIIGPSHIRLLSASRVQVIAGRITARVGPAGKGFAVDAPGADVVDLGTEFGVQVGPTGETAVVVFEGMVDLTGKQLAAGSIPVNDPAAAATRLTQGQAVRVAPGGAVERLATVERLAGGGDWRVDGPPAAEAVIASIHDNRRDPANPMYYQVARGALAEDVRAYVDRNYEWNGVDSTGLPSELIGADLVMPFNADKRTPDLELTVVLARPAALYVLHEPRHGEVPDWLKKDFIDTGLKVGLDEAPVDQPHKSLGRGTGQSIDRVFSVWRRDVPEPGPVLLGENNLDSKSMYGIAAKALPPGPDVSRGRAVMHQYCIECHSERKPKGKLNLAAVGHDPARPEFAGAWRQGIGRVRQSEMPPDDAPQPTPAEREALVAWMQWNLDRIAAAAPSAGRVTARRLNRLEYRNTIRDLLGVTFDPLTFDPTRDFPADGAGYGFDNIGDVLSVSPLHMEQYLSAAEQVLDRAIVVEGLDGPRARRFDTKDLRVAGIGTSAGAVTPITDTWSPRAWSADVDIRQGGEYLVRAEIVSDAANRKQAQMAFMLDGGKLEKFTLTREGKASKIERRVKLGKGPQQLAVAYLHEQGKPDFEPADGVNGGFVVRFMELAGPVGLTRETAPATHKAVFVGQPGEGKPRREAAREIVAAFATRAFRRPVTPPEVERYLKLFDAADVDGETFEAAVRAPLTAVLVSPYFLYRVEPDRLPETPGGDYALNGYELASRLSYFIWSSMPDAELMQSARDRRLADPGELERQAKRMIADPKSDVLGDAFASQWLQIRGVETLPQPDPRQFGKVGTALKDAMRAEPVMLFQHVLRTGRPLTDLIDADYTFLNEELAKQYKIDGVKGKEMRLTKLTDARRGGVLTMAGVLAVTSHPDRTSPVRRGKWVLDAILGAPPPPPPPDVGELPPGEATKNGKVQQVSLRERLEQHRAAASCAACHKRMDPLGFALENYDAVGRWRDKDGKLPVDAAATLPDGRAVNGPVELKRLMVAERDAFTACAAEKLLTFALGRGVEEPDRPVVAQIAKAAASDGYRLDRLVVEVVNSRPFRFRQSPPPAASTTQPAR